MDDSASTADGSARRPQEHQSSAAAVQGEGYPMTSSAPTYAAAPAHRAPPPLAGVVVGPNPHLYNNRDGVCGSGIHTAAAAGIGTGGGGAHATTTSGIATNILQANASLPPPPGGASTIGSVLSGQSNLTTTTTSAPQTLDQQQQQQPALMSLSAPPPGVSPAAAAALGQFPTRSSEGPPEVALESQMQRPPPTTGGGAVVVNTLNAAAAAAALPSVQQQQRVALSAVGPPTASTVTASASAINKKLEKERRKIPKRLESLVEYLTDLSRLLDRWDDNAAKQDERKTKLKRGLKKYIKRLGKLHTSCQGAAYQKENLPLGLVRHVDRFQSPQTWLSELYRQATLQHNCARGELQAIASFEATLRNALENGKKQCGDYPVEVIPAPPLIIPFAPPDSAAVSIPVATNNADDVTTGNDVSMAKEAPAAASSDPQLLPTTTTTAGGAAGTASANT